MTKVSKSPAGPAFTWKSMSHFVVDMLGVLRDQWECLLCIVSCGFSLLLQFCPYLLCLFIFYLPPVSCFSGTISWFYFKQNIHGLPGDFSALPSLPLVTSELFDLWNGDFCFENVFLDIKYRERKIFSTVKQFVDIKNYVNTNVLM